MAPPADSILLPAGTVLAETYEIEGTLGKPGGFGITYLARDRRLDDLVAVKEFFPMSIARRLGDGKTLVPATHDHAEAFAAGRQSFVAEARMLARFRHPNIVRVRSLFEENGTGYLVMDYLEGRTLASHLVRMGGHVPAETALAIARPLLSALRALHAQNVLHRDLDPHNVYITNQQEVVLLDFGAARQAQVTGDTRSLSVILKPGYAPYEQYASRGRQGPWTDVYALAATLYRMLAGHPPPEALSRLSDDDLVPVENAVRDRYGETLPPSLAAAIAWGLQVRPADRPQDVDAFAALLFADAEPPEHVAPAPVPTPRRPPPPAPASPPPVANRQAPPPSVPTAAANGGAPPASGGRGILNAPPHQPQPLPVPRLDVAPRINKPLDGQGPSLPPAPQQERGIKPRQELWHDSKNEELPGIGTKITLGLLVILVVAFLWGIASKDTFRPFAGPATQENMKGLVTALNRPTNAITIDGTAYTVSEGVVWPVYLAINDSVSFAAADSIISALDKIGLSGTVAADSLVIKSALRLMASRKCFSSTTPNYTVIEYYQGITNDSTYDYIIINNSQYIINDKTIWQSIIDSSHPVEIGVIKNRVVFVCQ